MVTEVFDGHFPCVIRYHGAFNTILVMGYGVKNWPLDRIPLTPPEFKAFILDNSPIPTDDWPFLYSAKPEISPFYQRIMAVILLTALVGVLLVSPTTLRRFSPPFFFLGAAFLLMETRGVTQMMLFFGSTWWVNAFVFFAILSVVYVANYIVLKKHPIPIPMIAIGILAGLFLCYIIPSPWILECGLATRIILSAIVFTIPILFGSMLFSTLFSQTTNIDAALGSNLLGAVVGGLLEFTCILLGMKNLYLIAAVLYILAVVTRKK
jgi:hypothetical protein